jgi:glucokinase
VLVNRDGEVLASAETKIEGEEDRTVDRVENRIVELVGQLEPQAVPGLPVGLGIPGFQDRVAGVVRVSPNFPDWVDVPVGDRLGRRLGRAVVVENDANCALLGEAWVGAARGLSDVVLLTLGTGIGTGFLVGGSLVRGVRGAGGEGGHLVIHPGGRTCGCGQQGCLEAYGSGLGLVETAGRIWGDRDVGKDPAPVSARGLFLLQAQGSPLAEEAMAQWCEDLGRGIAALVHVFSPAAVVLAGGMARHFDQFETSLTRAVTRHGIPTCLVGVLPLRRGLLGPLAGAVGAAAAGMGRS